MESNTRATISGYRMLVTEMTADCDGPPSNQMYNTGTEIVSGSPLPAVDNRGEAVQRIRNPHLLLF